MTSDFADKCLGLCRRALLGVMFAWGSSEGSDLAQAQDTAQVTVSITVEPFAEISFPQGTGFVIRVPPLVCWPLGWRWRHYRSCWDLWEYLGPFILPVRIPFVVEGNAVAEASVTPDSFLRIRGGRYLGKAVRPAGGSIGYHVIAHFPVPDPDYHWRLAWEEWDNWGIWHGWQGFGWLPAWARIAHLPGIDGSGTAPLPADLPALGGTAYGVVYVVARRDWTANGSRASPGLYYGVIEITVSADS